MAKTKAPASRAKSPPLSLDSVTVSPEEVVVFPVTKTPLGATDAQLVSICDFPRPGSPTTRTWEGWVGGWVMDLF